ncbi:uncharacterized protein At4g04775-like [Vicia villosa]|uniref:uncharacterized protein At4g04775-like n=1 Tax=Vicia villosa TaxID=3911 RepID=UPI00273BC982|nr:uncharacterized protein At4g04775-like [Vicia villosa]
MSQFSQVSIRSKSPFIRDECRCGLDAPLMTAWTDANPGRRFYGCGIFRDTKCANHFVWYDEEMTPRAKELISSLNEQLIIEKNKANEFKQKENELTMKMKFVKLQLKFTIRMGIVLLMGLVATIGMHIRFRNNHVVMLLISYLGF